MDPAAVRNRVHEQRDRFREQTDVRVGSWFGAVCRNTCL